MKAARMASLPSSSPGPSSFPLGTSPPLLAALLLLLAAAGCGRESSEVDLPAGVAASAEETRPLAVGAVMPDIELQDVDGRPVRLAGLVDQGPIALVFYRGGW